MSEMEKARINEMDAAEVVTSAQERCKHEGRWEPNLKAAEYKRLIRREAWNSLALGLLSLSQALACAASVATGDMVPVAAAMASGLISAGAWLYRAKVGFEA